MSDATVAEEEYLQTIFWLQEAGLPITGANVARAMQLSAPTVHEMVGRLERDGYISRAADKTISFTDTGAEHAEGVVRRKHPGVAGAAFKKREQTGRDQRRHQRRQTPVGAPGGHGSSVWRVRSALRSQSPRATICGCRAMSLSASRMGWWSDLWRTATRRSFGAFSPRRR